MATAYFVELIVKMTDAKCDKEHIPMIVYNKPAIPDRTDYILGKSTESPLDAITEIGRSLMGLGVDYIAIPCVTAHYFYEQLRSNISIPIINVLQETADYLKTRNISKVGIMATAGTIYSEHFKTELEKQGIEVVTPKDESQKKLMSIIYDEIKANKPYNIRRFKQIERELRELGAQVIILGCTELSLIKRDGKLGSGYIDAMEVLAAKSILMSGGALKEEYMELIS